MALEIVIREIPQIESINLDEGNIILVYVNDTVITGKSRTEIQRTVTELIKIGKGIGLVINSNKTEYIMVERCGEDHYNLCIGDKTF